MTAYRCSATDFALHRVAIEKDILFIEENYSSICLVVALIDASHGFAGQELQLIETWSPSNKQSIDVFNRCKLGRRCQDKMFGSSANKTNQTMAANGIEVWFYLRRERYYRRANWRAHKDREISRVSTKHNNKFACSITCHRLFVVAIGSRKTVANAHRPVSPLLQAQTLPADTLRASSGADVFVCGQPAGVLNCALQ